MAVPAHERLDALNRSLGSASVDTNSQIGSSAPTDVFGEASKPITDEAADKDQCQDFAFLDPPIQAGDLGFLAHYRVLKLIGQGGMGIVFLAEDARLHRLVALKVMRPELAREPMARHRFLREARATASVRSDHIVTIFEIGQADDLPYLATEFLQGMPLDAWLKRGNHPSPESVLEISMQIARGLDVAHKAGLIHRDIKPANIWVEEPGGRIKILDFGLARLLSASCDLTILGTIIGTLGYMAPEQAVGEPIDARSDLFSLGCVLYELAGGIKPFDGPSVIAVIRDTAETEPVPLQARNPALPVAFCQLVTRLLSKSPADRPASASEVIQTLEAIIADPVPNTVLSISPSQDPIQSAQSRRKNRSRWYVIAGMLGIFLVGTYLLQSAIPRYWPNFGPPVRGVTEKEVVLGMTAPFSGSSREVGREIEIGMRTYFNHVNDAGGIAGRKIKLVALDDGYIPERALANMQELYGHHGVLAIVGNVGTPTAEKTLPFALAKQMVFFGAFTGAPLLRMDPPDRYVFNYRASYDEELTAIVKYLIEIKRIPADGVAVFAQQDAYGDAGFNAVAKAMRKYGRQSAEIARVGHPRGAVEVGDAVQAILRDKQIRAVVMITTHRPAANFIQELKDANADLLFANVSAVNSDALAQELCAIGPSYAPGIIVSQAVPHPESQSSIARKYRAMLKRSYPNAQPGFLSFEGYVNAVILSEGLIRAGNDLDNESLVEALESIQSIDIGLGVPLRFGPSEHQASHKVWGTVLDKQGNYQILDLE